MRVRWRAVHDDGRIVTSGLPLSYENRIDRRQRFRFELLSDDDQVVRAYDVEPSQRLLFRTRARQSFGGLEAKTFAVIVGLEDRETSRVLFVERLIDDFGGTSIERRDAWGVEGEDDFAAWVRPIPDRRE